MSFGASMPAMPPLPEPPPPPPTIDQARLSRQREDEARRRRGRAATVLTDGSMDRASLVQPKTAAKTLLGG
jgi:hypothetical protein